MKDSATQKNCIKQRCKVNINSARDIIGGK